MARRFLSLLLIPTLLSFSPILQAEVPTASIDDLDSAPFIGEEVSFSVTFDNTAPNGSNQTGYGPFIDVILPVNGADGTADGEKRDGLDFVSAHYLGAAVTTTALTFPDDGTGSGCVDHPYAVDNSATPLEVCGPQGDKLIVVELPFGSFVPEQPPAPVTFSTQLSDYADLGTPLTLRTRGGFRFGADELDNPGSDPSILTGFTDYAITPTLIRLTKSGDDGATGPNYPRSFGINIDVAPGQTITDLDLTDPLPLDVVYGGTSGGTVVQEPALGQVVSPDTRELQLNLASVDDSGATVTVNYYVAEAEHGGDDVIDRVSGDDVSYLNQITALGDWNPLDPRDSGATDNVTASASHSHTDESIDIAKGVAVVADTGAAGPSPGDTLEYTLHVDISDYFAFRNIALTDVFNDGQRWDSGFTPTLSVTRHGTSRDVEMRASNVTVDESAIGNDLDPATDGSTTVRFDVSQELINQGFSDGHLLGGCVPPTGTDSSAGGSPTTPPADCSAFDQGATTFTIRFRTVIQQDFSDSYPSGDSSVDQGDSLDNDVEVSADLLSVVTLQPHSTLETDSAGAGVTIARGVLQKSIYALNGATPVGNPVETAPADVVTYRLRYELHTANVEALNITDYLPLPVFRVPAAGMSFDPSVSTAVADVPPADTIQYGPDDSFHLRPGAPQPTVTTDTDANSVTFDYDSYDDLDDSGAVIDLLISVPVTDNPFADGLFLTNQVQISEGSTFLQTAQTTEIVQIQLNEPALNITKGVSASNGNPDAEISPSPSSLPVDGNLSRADGGDGVTFVLTVENRGGAPAFDVTVTDNIPTGLNNCSVTTVTDGSGSGLAYSGDLFGSGLNLTDSLAANDDNPAEGGAPYSDDTALITYTCDIDATVNPGQSLEESAAVVWAARPGATPFDPISDEATVSIASPQLTKSVVTISPGGAGGGRLTAGDEVTYRLAVVLPEGQSENLQLVDTLPAGLELVTGSVVLDTSGFVGTIDSSPTVGVSGQTVSVAFDSPATTVVTDDNDVSNNGFSITLQARVLDDGANDGLPATQGKVNNARLEYDGGSVSDSLSTDFAEPQLSLTKSMSPATDVDAGDTVTVTLTLQNTGTAPAYDVVVTDVLNDNGDLFDLSTVTEGTTATGYTFDYTDPTVTYTLGAGQSLGVGATVNFTFTVRVRDNVITGSTFGNTASVSGDGQSGTVPGERSMIDDDSDTVTVTPAAVSKTLTASSESFSSDSASPPRVAIGEVLTFQATFDIPEGVTRDGSDGGNAIISDTLPAGFEYVPGTATIRAVADTVLSGTHYPGTTLPFSDTLITPTVNGQRLEFDLGDITNTDSDADVEQIVLVYDVLVLNTADNNRGDDKLNTARLTYLNRDNNPQNLTDTQTVRIAAPQLTLTKDADPATVSGGETVTFTVVLSNGSGDNVLRAWEPQLADSLPSRYQNPVLSAVTLGSDDVLRDGRDLSACGSFSGNALTLVLTVCQAATEAYLDPGERVTIVYTATLVPTVDFEETVTNTAAGQATSLPGSAGSYPASGAPGDEDGERTGSGGINDLSASDNATITAARPTLTKSVDQPLRRIGQIATMTLELGVPVGITGSFEVTDELPAGLVYTGDPVEIVLPAGSFSAGNAPSTTPGAGTDPLEFDFGSVTNSAATTQTITIRYPVRVTNVAANQNGNTLTNTATLDFQDASLPLPRDSATVTVDEPDLEITKTVTGGATGADGGDTVSFRVEVSNTDATATAYRVDLRDVLPAELLGANGGAGPFFGNIALNNPGNAVVLSGDGTPLQDTDAWFDTTALGDDTLTWPLFDLPAGVTLTLSYDAVVTADAPTGATLDSPVTAGYHSLADGAAAGRDGSSADSDDDDDADLNNYNESDSATLTLDAGIAIQKTLADSHSDSDVTLGDTVTFDLRVDLLEGVTNNVVITDTLPAGLSYQAPVSVIATPNISYDGPGTGVEGAAGTVDIDLGDVTNSADGDGSNDFLIVQLQARVEEVPGNVQGTVLTNPAEVSADQGSAGPDIQAVTVMEPTLTVSKAADSATPSLGDEVTFTLTVRHEGSGFDAYDVALIDALPAALSYVPGSTLGAGVDESDPARPRFDLGTLLLADLEKTFSFRARVDTDAAVGQAITNTIDLTYDTQPGDPAVERTYSASGSDQITPGAAAFIDAVKTVALIGDGGTAGQVDPGDTLEYTVVLTNTGPAADNVVFTDTLPAGLSYVAASLNSSAGSSDDGAAPLLAVEVGTLAPSASVTVTFRATVDAGVPPGTVFNNQGTVDSDQTVPEPTDLDGVDGNGDQPTPVIVGGGPALNRPLYAEKRVALVTDADGSGTVSPGDTLAYTVELLNRGDQTLSNLSLTDTVPAGLTVQSGRLSSSAGSLGVAGQTLNWTGIAALAPGEFVAARFEVVIDTPLVDHNGAADTETFTNQGMADADQVTPVPTDGNGDPSDGYQSTAITAVNGGSGAPLLDLEKRVTLTVDNDGDGQADPGDVLGYRLTLSNDGPVAATDVRLSDAVPTGTSAVGGSVTSSQGAVVSDNPVAVNLGTLAPGGVATVAFRVTVAAGTEGQVIANQAIVSAANAPDEPSDDNGSDDDGKNPTLTPVGNGAGLAGPLALNKVLVASSEAASAGSEVLIGEVVTFRVSIELPVGTLSQAEISDILPPGLSYLPGSARLARTFDTGLRASFDPGGINTTASGLFASLSDGVDIVSSGRTLSLLLGDVINSDADADGEGYTLEYRAIINNEAGNQTGTTLDNSATLSYLDALFQPRGLTPVNHTLTVIEPNPGVSKSATPQALLEGGGTVDFTVTVTNPDGGHSAPAYDLSLADTLGGEWSAVRMQSITPAGGVTGVSDTSAGNTVSLTVDSFPVDGTLTLVYRATAAGPLSRSSLDNTVSLNWTSLPGERGSADAAPGNPGQADGERDASGSGPNDYFDAAVATVTVDAVALTKTRLTPQSRYAVGEAVDYRLEISLPAGVTVTDAVLSDVLDPGLSYRPESLDGDIPAGVSISGSLSDFGRRDDTPAAGQETLSLNLGTVSNTTAGTQVITLDYRAVVDNLLVVQNNANLDNRVTLDFEAPGDGGIISLTDTTQLTVGEPHLALEQIITSPRAGLEAGDTVDFQVTVTNDGNTTAYKVVLSNPLPDALNNIGGLTVVGIRGAAEVPILTHNGDDWISSGFDLPVGAEVVLSFNAELATSVTPGQAIQNRVRATFSSVEGDDSGQRDGSSPDSHQDDDGDLNNYNVEALAPTVTAGDPVQLDKRFHPDAEDTDYTLGETLTYRLTVSMLEGMVNDLQVTDTLPDGVVLVDSKIGVGNLAITHAYPGAPLHSGRSLTFDFGTVINPANGADDDDYLTLDITVRVADVAANVDGMVLGNFASLVFAGPDGPLLRDFDIDERTPGLQPLDLTVVEPDLRLTKHADREVVPPGDSVTFTLVLDHTPDSHAEAYDLTITDTLPAGLEYVPGSGDLTPTVSGRTLIFSLAALTRLDDQRRLRYRARVAPGVALGEVLTNTALAAYDSRPGQVDDQRRYDTGPATARVTTGETTFIEALQDVALVIDRDGDGRADPGDTVEYTVQLHNTGNRAADNVLFRGTLPEGLTYIDGSLTSDTGITDAGAAPRLAVTMASLAAGARATIRYQATVDATVAAGTVLDNQGWVDSDQTVAEPTDGDGDRGNGNQPTTLTTVADPPTPSPRPIPTVHPLGLILMALLLAVAGYRRLHSGAGRWR